jgi:hypothetical protein
LQINSLFFKKKIRQKKMKNFISKLLKIVTFANYSFKIFCFRIFEYCQIWLNTLMDDLQLSNITKLGEKNKPKTRFLFFITLYNKLANFFKTIRKFLLTMH